MTDFSSNAPVALVTTAAKPVDTVTLDGTRPECTAFSIDMDKGQILLTFSEVVEADDIAPTALTVQDAATASANVALSLDSSATASTTDGLVITVTISVSDLNAIKGRAMANADTDTFLLITAAGAKDMNGNTVVAIEDGSALVATGYAQDNRAPTLTQVDLNMNDGTLTMLFSETVSSLSFEPTEFKLHPQADGGGTAYVLSAGTWTTTDSQTIVLKLSSVDLNKLTADLSIAISDVTSYLSMTTDAVDDVSGNKITTQPANGPLKVATFTPDTTDAELVGFAINMNAGSVSLTFKETVNHVHLKVGQVTLQASATGGPSVTLSAGSTPTTTSPNTVINFDLVADDLNDLKTTAGLCTAVANTWVSVGADLIKDMNNRGTTIIQAGSALQVASAGFAADTTKPIVNSFTADFNTGKLVIAMSEPIADAVDLTKLTLASKSGTKSYTLTSVSSSSLDTSKLVLTVTIGTTDLNLIKAEPELAVSDESTVLTIADAFARDRATTPNTIAVLEHSDDKIPITFTVDSTPPELQDFHFDVATGKLTTFWSETVNVETFQKDEFHFVKQAGDRRRRSVGAHKSKKNETVHRGIICDASDMNPIVGRRFHLMGGDYDLCEQEFLKLSQEERIAYEIIDAPGSTPTKYVPS